MQIARPPSLDVQHTRMLEAFADPDRWTITIDPTSTNLQLLQHPSGLELHVRIHREKSYFQVQMPYAAPSLVWSHDTPGSFAMCKGLLFSDICRIHVFFREDDPLDLSDTPAAFLWLLHRFQNILHTHFTTAGQDSLRYLLRQVSADILRQNPDASGPWKAFVATGNAFPDIARTTLCVVGLDPTLTAQIRAIGSPIKEWHLGFSTCSYFCLDMPSSAHERAILLRDFHPATPP